MNPFSMIGLGPHDFADPYETYDEDDLTECCGVRTPNGSPCGYPRSMHRRLRTAAPDLARALGTRSDSRDAVRQPGVVDSQGESFTSPTYDSP
jgi:hypothetical protein